MSISHVGRAKLQLSDTFKVSVTETEAEDRIVGRANFAPFSAVAKVGDFNAICKDRDAVWLNEFEHDHLVGSAIDPKNRVGTFIEFLYPISGRASESFATNNVDTQIGPWVFPFEW